MSDLEALARTALLEHFGHEPNDAEVAAYARELRKRRARGGGPLPGGPPNREEVERAEILLEVATLRGMRPDIGERQARRLVGKARAEADAARSEAFRAALKRQWAAALAGDAPVDELPRVEGDFDPVRYLDTRVPAERGGRPPGITSIENDEQLAKPVREMLADKRRISYRTLAGCSGMSESTIRGYLRVTHRTLREFLTSL